MALALFFIGLVLIVSGIKGTQSQLADLLASEFTGAGNFWAFIFGIFFLGALGYYPPLRNTSRMLIGLTLLVLILSNGGFWQNLVSAVNNPQRISSPGGAKVPAPIDVKEAAKSVGEVGKFIDDLGKNNNLGIDGGFSIVTGIIGKLF